MQAKHSQNNFDAMRLVAASMVIFSHCFLLSGIKRDSANSWLELAFQSGGIGVSIFFLMSGYLVTSSFYNSKNTLHFLWKRILRIYPALITAVIITTLLGGLVTDSSFSEYYKNSHSWHYIFNALIPSDNLNKLPGVFINNPVSNSINGSLWTIRLELLLYLTIAIMGAAKILNEKVIIYTCLAMFVIFIAAFNGVKILPAQLHQDISPYSMRSILTFYLGSLFYLRGKNKGEGNLSLTLLLAVFATVFFPYPAFKYFSLVMLPFIIVNAAFLWPGNPLNRIGKFGDYSYGMYLYAYPIQQTLMHFLQGKIHLWQYMILSFTITFIFAFLSWHLVEKWVLQLKRQ